MPTKSIKRVVAAIRVGRLTFDDYLRILPFDFAEWQRTDLREAVERGSAVFIRSRRGGKTRDMTVLAVWFILCGRRVVWYAPTSDQRDAAVQYFLLNPFVRDVTRDGRVIVPYSGGEGRLLMLTMGKTAGGSADVVFYDELGKVEVGTRMYEFWLYSEAVNAASERPMTFYASTPYANSAFEEVAERAGDVLIRTVDECPWVSREELGRLKSLMPKWAFRQEFYCEFVVPGGALVDRSRIVVRNVSVSGLPVGIGVDFNGPNTGHYVVFAAYDADNNAIIIFDERVVHSVEELVAIQRAFPIGNARWEIETGLFNDEYVKECMRKGLKADTPKWNDSRILSRVYRLCSFDAIVFTREGMATERDLRRAEWDGPKPKKRRDQHAFDAMLHALCVTDGGKVSVGGKVLNTPPTFNIL